MKTTTERTEALDRLRGWLKPGDTVYTILRHVSKSGMQREVGVVIQRDGDFLHPNYAVSQAIGVRLGKRDGVIMNGCGTDMGFEVVYNLGRALWPEGVPCAGPNCPSNDHSNGDRNHEPHVHNDGGYALRHRWL